MVTVSWLNFIKKLWKEVRTSYCKLLQFGIESILQEYVGHRLLVAESLATCSKQTGSLGRENKFENKLAFMPISSDS